MSLSARREWVILHTTSVILSPYDVLVMVNSLTLDTTGKECNNDSIETDDQRQKFPSVFISDRVLTAVETVRSLGHIIRNDLWGDEDEYVQHQGCKLCAQANMLICKFQMCTDVKIELFRADCTPLYTDHLKCNYIKAKMKVAEWTSASSMFVLLYWDILLIYLWVD